MIRVTAAETSAIEELLFNSKERENVIAYAKLLMENNPSLTREQAYYRAYNLYEGKFNYGSKK